MLPPHRAAGGHGSERSLPCWDGGVRRRLDAGQRVLLVAHGNSLRALVKHLDQMDDKTIAGLGIPTGVPLLHRLDTSLRPIEHHYLGDAETMQETHASPQGPVQGHDASATRHGQDGRPGPDGLTDGDGPLDVADPSSCSPCAAVPGQGR